MIKGTGLYSLLSAPFIVVILICNISLLIELDPGV